MKSLALCTLRIKSGCTKFAPIKGQLISKCLFGEKTWSNQSVGQKMSRKIDFQKVTLRDICEIFKTC